MIGQIVKFVRMGLWAPMMTPTASTGLTAAGSTQATALALTAEFNQFSTVAASTGATLPAGSEPGDEILVINNGANALAVYPTGTGTINTGSASAALSVAAGKAARFTCIGGGTGLTRTWVGMISA